MRYSLVIKGKKPVAIMATLGAVTLFTGETLATEGNYNVNAAGTASSQGQNNANCNSALRRDACEAEIAYDEASSATIPSQPLPEPGTLLLLGTAILILFAVKKLSRRNIVEIDQGNSQAV